MIPIGDTTPRRTTPYVTWGLIAANLAVFAFELMLAPSSAQALTVRLGLIPAVFLQSSGLERWPPLFTSMFLHAGWFHVGANMVTLWIFGDNVEDRLGHLKFLLFYLACGVVAGLSHTYLNAASTLPTVGASGAIAGVLGGYLLLYPRGRVVTIIPLFYFLHVVELPAIVYLGFWFISQVFSGLLALGAPAYQAGVAWWAHLGGFVAGLLLVLPMRGRPLPRRYTRDFEW